MMKKLFDKNRKEIQQLFDWVLANPYSDFYRRKFTDSLPARISTYDDFQKIPFLYREEIQNTRLDKRAFVSKNQVVRYSISEGTAGAAPLVIPRDSQLSLLEDYSYNQLVKLDIRVLLALVPTFSPVRMSLFERAKGKSVLLMGDINDYELTANLAKKAGIKGIFSTPSLLNNLIRSLEEQDFDMQSIKWVSIGRELCTGQFFSYITEEFSKAKIFFRFPATENDGLAGFQCEYLSGKSPFLYHPNARLFLEIIDKNGKLLREGETGEIVCTDIQSKAFPFLRYKSGIPASLSKQECKCGNNLILELA